MAKLDPLSLIENSIRQSVLADMFQATPALLDIYLGELDRMLKAAPSEAPVLYARGQKILEWTNQLVLASREETRGALSHLRALNGYGEAPACQTNLRTDA